MSYADYDAFNGGFDAAGGFSETNMDNGGQHSQKAQTRSTLTPVTIKQIHEAQQDTPDSEWKINNVELSMVSIVGVVRKLENTSSALIFTIEDGTGSFDIRKWVNDEETSVDSEYEYYKPFESKYVHVTGVLKMQSNRKGINQSNIKLVNDHNQVLYHQLSAIKVHLEAQGAFNKLNAPGSNDDNKLFVSDGDHISSGAPAGSLKDQIHQIIRANTATMNEGVPLAYIAQKLNLPPAKVEVVGQELVEEGAIYNGYEDNTYLVF